MSSSDVDGEQTSNCCWDEMAHTSQCITEVAGLTGATVGAWVSDTHEISARQKGAAYPTLDRKTMRLVSQGACPPVQGGI